MGRPGRRSIDILAGDVEVQVDAALSPFAANPHRPDQYIPPLSLRPDFAPRCGLVIIRATMPRHSRISSYRKLCLTVLLVSLGTFLLPGRWTGGLISLVQVLVPFQHAATAAAGFADEDGAEPDSSAPVPGKQHAALQRERDALEHQVAAIASRLRQLESEVEILTATRLWDVGGRGIGPVGKLIPAQVVAKDLLAWRESRLVTVVEEKVSGRMLWREEGR